MTLTDPLSPVCLSVPNCGKPRLAYRGYCADHGPLTTPLPPSRCLAPIRCYCPACSDREAPSCPLPSIQVLRAQVRETIQGRRRHLEVVR